MKSPQEIAELVAARLRTAYDRGTGPVYRDPVEEIAAAVSAERARADGLREALADLLDPNNGCYCEGLHARAALQGGTPVIVEGHASGCPVGDARALARKALAEARK